MGKIGSGAQSEVFKGQFKDEVVAVKQVLKKEEENISDLRHFYHPNLIFILLVLYIFRFYLKFLFE